MERRAVLEQPALVRFERQQRVQFLAAAELARLEEERRKLEEAHREFAEFVENVRRAKDREEFERFMNGAKLARTRSES